MARAVWITAAVALAFSAPAAAQDPPEPWSFRAQLDAQPALLRALDELFSLAAAGDEGAFRARFTPNTVARLEEAWAAQTPPSGSWASMMAALVSSDGRPPSLVQITTDDPSDPQRATVVIAIDGRQHALYLKRDALSPREWALEVRELGVDLLDLDSLNLSITLPAKEKSLMELSFGSGFAVPRRYLFNYDDNVNLSLTPSLWITVELFLLPWLRVGALCDLPLGFQDLMVDGEVVSEFVPARPMAGVTWTPLYVDFATQSRLEAQLLTYLGLTIEGAPRLVPQLAGRVAFLQNAYEGADIYAGLYYQGVVDVFGLLYGVGYRF
jgi:hypothetical protein